MAVKKTTVGKGPARRDFVDTSPLAIGEDRKHERGERHEIISRKSPLTDEQIEILKAYKSERKHFNSPRAILTNLERLSRRISGLPAPTIKDDPPPQLYSPEGYAWRILTEIDWCRERMRNNENLEVGVSLFRLGQLEAHLIARFREVEDARKGQKPYQKAVWGRLAQFYREYTAATIKKKLNDSAVRFEGITYSLQQDKIIANQQHWDKPRSIKFNSFISKYHKQARRRIL